MCEWVHMCACACGRQKSTLGVVSHVLSAFSFEIGSFHETWSLQIKSGFLASESLGFSWFCISNAGIKETDYNA